MTFESMRWGFPNTAAILALAAMPFVATVADWQPKATATARMEAAAICQPVAESMVLAAAALPELILE